MAVSSASTRERIRAISAITPTYPRTVPDFPYLASDALAAAAPEARTFRESLAYSAYEAAGLGPDWRSRIPGALVAVGEAWCERDAWTGMTRAGGVDLPAEVAGHQFYRPSAHGAEPALFAALEARRGQHGDREEADDDGSG